MFYLGFCLVDQDHVVKVFFNFKVVRRVKDGD